MTTRLSNLVGGACWLVFVLYWFINSRRVKSVAEPQSRSSLIPHRLRMLAAVILIGSPYAPGWLALVVTPRTETLNLTGALLCVLGLLVAIWARRTLGGNWSSSVTFKQDHELIQDGPYRFVRHPIYTGLLIMILGSVLVVGRLHAWLGFLLMSVSIWIKLRQEERLMEQHFPQYADYRSRVRAIVPFVL